MKSQQSFHSCSMDKKAAFAVLFFGWFCVMPLVSRGDLLYETDFEGGIPGWTAVQPAAGDPYSAGPMRWIYDTVHGGFSENSNIFTGNTVAPMLINETAAGATFSYVVRMNMGDNDGSGVVFGYLDESNFYRITFGVQDRGGFPFTGWSFDQMVGGESTVLAGDDGSDAFVPVFTPTRGTAFDVIIELGAGNVLNLSVMDAVESDAPTPVALIESMTLPSSAAGQVGLMVWGQSGGNPPGVLYTSVSLDGSSLVNNPPTLSEWTNYVPANAIGESAGVTGNWGLALGQDGSFGTLNESSNGNLAATDIDGNTHIDFSAPTFVVGDSGWTDYTFTARIIPSDNDGHGVVVRFRDPDNFYRIALASQGDGDGRPWQGVSVQKKAKGIWSEIFHDEALGFIAPDDVPYDIAVKVNGDDLEVVITADPEGAADIHFYGPFNITGDTVDSGGAGIFSWGMNYTEVDFVRVESDILFADSFNGGIPGWTAVQPAAGDPYSAGPMRWIYDVVHGGFSENSNIFTGNTVAPMLINETAAGDTLAYKVRMNMGDNDGSGVVFGYLDESNFYRITFGVQDRGGFPFTGWSFDQMVGGESTVLAGDDGSDDFVPVFTPTRGKAFDVIIEVGAGNVLNLSVMDAVETDAPTSVALIESMTLPSSAAGQVGLMVWGQSGGNPPGVLFSSSSLDGVSLIINPPTLSNWTNYVPANALGESAGVAGNWGLALGQDGSFGTLNESSNGNLAATDIDGNTHIDFSAPTFVTGDSGWTDYTFTARIIPSDNDGHGVVVRFQDPDNFYRIALARQGDGDGRPWQGVSVQKKANGLWSEIFHDEALSFIPPDDVPYDIAVTVQGNRLEFSITADPEGAADFHFFGPFIITGDTVDSGGVGIFSWGMNYTEVDFVRVESDILFADNFGDDIPGWTSVQPAAGEPYSAGPLRWIYDVAHGGFIENSNIYSPPAGFSTTRVAPMMINDTVAGETYTFKVRINSTDNDGNGLVFGYQDENNFYRMTFANQNRAGGFPWHGWSFDRMVDGVPEILAGDDGSVDFDSPTFVLTRGDPFDVTIAVGPGNSLNVSVAEFVDSGFPFETSLIESLTLPTSAAGQVGLMVWGQSSTASLSGIFFSDLSLDPVALVNPAPETLSEWTSLAPGNAVGESSGLGNWGLAWGPDGLYRSLNESSNVNLAGTDINGNDHIDFSAPTIVAGDENWTDYLYTARIIPSDNDGHGVVFRFKDPDNFYRIALASQGDGGGRPWQGVSAQKKVNGVWSEIYHQDLADPGAFIPPDDVPYDILVTISGNRLEFVITGDPEGAAETHFYGPFNLTGDTVDRGKIGLFSWGMQHTEFDFVKVELSSGIPLQINSQFGNPSPPIGLSNYEVDESVTATVEDVVEESPGVRRLLTGWTGDGSVPASGTSNSVTFSINQFSFLTWEWQSEFRLEVAAGAGGSVAGADQDWYPEGAAVTLEVMPDVGFLFAGWSGSASSSTSPLSLTMSGPVSLSARFTADSDGDGLADDWEIANFGNLAVNPGGDGDNDGADNLTEFQRGTDPNFAEQLISEDGINARWENVKRDPTQSGLWLVQDFGQGYRGVTENTNNHRGASLDGGPTPLFPVENIVPQISFEGPRMIVSKDVWNPDWKDYVLESTIVVGDNDGNSLYFRYQDEENWYRFNIEGTDGEADWRPPFGASIQKKVNGIYTDLGRDDRIAMDPSDTSWFKQVKVRISAIGSNFEVQVTPYDTLLVPPAYNEGLGVVISFIDDSLADGRVGFGSWGQSGTRVTDLIPVGAGTFHDNMTVTVDGVVVFEENWENEPLQSELPDGWENPLTGTPNAGTWIRSPDSIVQNSNALTSTTGTLQNPKADGEGPILLAPDQMAANYFLEIGFHPFDNDGIGFVYDYIDSDNYARVLFNSQDPTGDGSLPQGVNISRKSEGVWTDIVVQDRSFIYRQGQPFGIEFSNNNGSYQLFVWESDDPENSASFSWTGPSASEGNRFGLATWGEEDAHFTYARASSLPTQATGPLTITGISVGAGQVVLDVDSSGAAYDVERATDLGARNWEIVATGQTGNQWTGDLPTDSQQAYWRLSGN